MNIIVCLDDALGMSFNGRRQSRDRLVTDDILSVTSGKKLYITAFSEKLFAHRGEVYTVDVNMLDAARSGEYCFVENIAIKPYISRVEEIVIYRWNRRYPADMHFDIDLESEGFAKVGSTEFEGYSHEKITKEIYRR